MTGVLGEDYDIHTEGLIMKLKLQYFGHLMWRTDSLEKTLMLGKTEGKGDDREWDGWMASQTWWTWVWVGFGRWWWTGKPDVLQSLGSQSVGHDWEIGLNWRCKVYLFAVYSMLYSNTGLHFYSYQCDVLDLTFHPSLHMTLTHLPWLQYAFHFQAEWRFIYFH